MFFYCPIFSDWKYVQVKLDTHEEQVVTLETDRIDMREHVIDFGKQNVITKDTGLLWFGHNH